ncbi:MAG TPA: OsmC family protein [Chitinophagaceae bacterium]|nr:OsmC family protein [Chitinophagaceae bacterium]
MTITTTVWHKNHEFTSSLDHNTIKIDGSRKNGFGPKALLLAGLAGCSGIDIVDILKKMRVDFSGFSIQVKAEQTEDLPKVYKDIYIAYKVKTGKENEEKVKKAIDLSLEKYCGVSAMLQKNSPIHYTLEIV